MLGRLINQINCYTSGKQQKTRGFRMLSGGKERETKNFSKRIHELPYQNVKFSYLVNE